MTTPAPTPYRVVQIGAGRFSRLAHGPALQQLAAGPAPAVRLEGICDVDPLRPERAERFRDDFGYARSFADVARMLDEAAPDLVVCSVQSDWTPTIVRLALRRGLAVFTEKPPARTARESADLADMAARSQTLTYVAFNRRRMPSVEFAKAWIGGHDRLVGLRARLLRVNRRADDFLMTTGVHAIDTLRYLAGEVIGIESSSGTRTSLHFNQGVRGDLEIRVDAPIAVERYTLTCEESVVDVTVGTPYSDASLWAGVQVRRGTHVETVLAADRDWLRAAGIIDEHRACLRSLAAQAESDCSLADASRTMAVAEAIGRPGDR